MADKQPPPASAPTAPSAVRGASLLIALQVASRAATFIANQLLLRFLTAQLLGVATQLEVYYLSVLFFARESLRVAIQRQGGREQPQEGAKSPKENASKGGSYVSILLGSLVALLLGWLYLASIHKTTDEDGNVHNDHEHDHPARSLAETTPFLVPSLYLYAFASAIELLSEPAFVVLQLRLQFGARAAAESVATVLRCATTLGAAVLATRLGDGRGTAGRGIDLGVLPFALGQLAYGVGLLAVYAWHGASLARRDGFSLFPRRLAGPYALQLFDRPTLHLASSMSVQSIVKHMLTQGDTFLVSVLSTTTTQGVYALANNYGGLAARLLFQPIEESSRSYFSRLLAEDDKEHNKETSKNAPTERAARDLQTLLKLYLLFSLVVTAIGPAAAAPFLGLVTGPRWANSGAAATLAAYVWYIPLLAINGVAEAFVASVATEAQVYRQSVWMGGFSAVFAAAGYICLRVLDGGAVGLVAANGINMACRIVWCLVFIRRYFAARGISFFGDATSSLMPHPFAVLAAVVTSTAVRRFVPAPMSTGPVAQITQLVKIAVLAVPFLLTV
ncbi:oligosaccharidyl-lipid flippase family [Sporothrix brasiliensis 5110]|uniref:Man(5)GlcNAc(2)-PP-dolichol translocation protein RFT1 n=1 Tax=Sporothrix brasiliensis 5110 TaxID=1398154 RepID=A0A0C2IE94_9PEZI|nr:oligosaccharidyl-lipid flippase family [Sporothrix brasiliensis 5110]KIH87581.1 oligosaccharidyl-lipid flippase family [Sporothrix brasiliensis 5110]